jgi:hypothetical protein
VFEAVMRWPLYGELPDFWHLPTSASVVYRGDSLRALASVGHSLIMGYLCAVAFGVWAWLARQVPSTAIRIGFGAWMWIGMITAYSRAPWLVAIMIFVVYLALQPRGFVRLMQVGVIGAIAGGVALASPIGGKIIDNLPFVGTVDSQNVVYRQRLADISWFLIQQNPVLGDPFVLDKMEEMRQGEGIIDLVNTYAAVALFSGLVGAALFSSVLLSAATRFFSAMRRAAKYNQDYAALGACLLACVGGTAFMLVTCSFIMALALMYWILPGLAVTYDRLEKKQASGEGVL